jgi:3-hydroxybutyrate dehydrogenase
MDINLTHPIRVTQLAISHFLKHKKPGVVIHVSSVAGQVPFFPTPLYVAAKHALNGFVRSLDRLEYPPAHLSHIPKIRVNSVAPARILTPLWTENPDKLRMLADNPGWILPETVAKVMLDLVQTEEYVGGSIVEVGEKVRVVQTYGDLGPKGGGNAVQHDSKEETDMWASIERQYGGVEMKGKMSTGNNGVSGMGLNGVNGDSH